MKKYWKYVGIGSLGVFAGNLVLPVLAPYFSSLGYSEQWISFVFALFPFVMFTASFLSGEFADRFGKAWLIRTGLLMTALAYLLYFAGSPFSIVTGRILDGIGFAILAVLVLAKIEDVIPSNARGKYTGWYLSIRDGARFLGPLIGGYLADQWIGSVFITAIVILSLTALVFRKTKLQKTERTVIHPVRDLLWFLKDRKLRPLAILGPASNGLLSIKNIYIPLLVVGQLGLSYAAVGAVMSAYLISHTTQFIWGKMADSMNVKNMMIAGCLTMAGAMLYMPLTASFMGLLALSVVAGTGASVWNVACIKWLSDVGEKVKKEGTVLGAYVSIAKLGEGFTYVIGGIAVGFLGLPGAFYTISGLAMLGIFIATIVFHKT